MVRVAMFLSILPLLFLPGCQRREAGSSGAASGSVVETAASVRADEASDSTRDAIDLAIVQCAPRVGSCNPFVLSAETQGRLSKYKATCAIATEGGLFSTPVAGGAKLMIPDGSVLRCTFRGDLEVTVRLMGGTVGIQDNEIFAEEGSKCQVDADAYVFQGGRWRRQP